MKYVILFAATFLLVLVLYWITVISNKRKLSKFDKSNQALLLIKKYKLDINKDNVKSFAWKIAFANAIIIATTITIIEFINNFMLKLLIAFLVMIPLILILYKVIGKI